MPNKIIRGWIIRILQRAYPLGLEDKSLQKQLHALGYEITKTELNANLTYLEEDEYVEVKTYGDAYGFDSSLSNKTYKLTTKGVDLAEKNITDDGVEL